MMRAQVYINSQGCAVNETKGAKCSRKTANIAMQKPHGPSPDANFSFTAAGQLQSASGVCLGLVGAPGPQLWAKAIGKGTVAILVLNTAGIKQTFSVPIADIPKVR